MTDFKKWLTEYSKRRRLTPGTQRMLRTAYEAGFKQGSFRHDTIDMPNVKFQAPSFAVREPCQDRIDNLASRVQVLEARAAAPEPYKVHIDGDGYVAGVRAPCQDRIDSLSAVVTGLTARVAAVEGNQWQRNEDMPPRSLYDKACQVDYGRTTLADCKARYDNPFGAFTPMPRLKPNFNVDHNEDADTYTVDLPSYSLVVRLDSALSAHGLLTLMRGGTVNSPSPRQRDA